MKYRILDLMRSTPVMVVGILLLMGGLYLFVRGHGKEPRVPVKQSMPKLPLVKGGNDSLKEAPVIETNPFFSPWHPLAVFAKKTEPPAAPQSIPSEPRPKLIHDYEQAEQVQKAPVKEMAVPKRESPTIPFGRVVPCRLLQTVQCGKAPVPVIAELLQPVRDAKGKEWIPRGTRIHGTLQAGNLPGRVESAGEWIFVLPGQKLLKTKASLQDRDIDALKGSYGIHDGMAGIAGKTVQARKSGWKQTVLKEGTAIAAEASQDRMKTALGEVELGSARNAVLRGVSSLVSGALPKQSETSVESYVELPAGKEFYLYFNDREASQTAAKTPDVETIMTERAKLMQQLRQKTGRANP